MENDMLDTGKNNVRDIRIINRNLTEKALHMRCLGYLSKVKEQLLMETIFEIDHSKKYLAQTAIELKQQHDMIHLQNAELELKNLQLEELKKELEHRVEARTADLQHLNEKLRHEIAERKQAEVEKEKMRLQFLQAQKMESMGRLASGVAHDFNNFLTAILGYSQLALSKLPAAHPLTEDLNIILSAGEKSAALVRQLMVFSRKQVLEMKIVDLNQMVENMARMLDRILGEDLKMTLHLEKPLGTIEADIGQIEQVLLNLVVNARDAMPAGGRLTIETANVLLDETYTRSHPEVIPGTYAMLAVTDTGEGMTPEIQANIFEPFFTTKEREKGTGLGLATVHGIVKQHNGHIYVYSEPGKGSAFKIYFRETGKDVACTLEKAEAMMPTGSETILVVEDEAAIRTMVSDTLKSLGYTVLEATSGDSALELFHHYPQEISLLLTDVVMPGIDGKVLKDVFMQKIPAIKVLFMSGYSDTLLVQRGILDSHSGFLHKPFSPSKLANRIRLLLDC